MQVPLVVLDIDGTLLQPDGTVSARVRAAVEAVRAAGTLVTLATGRRLWAVRPIADQLAIHSPVILYNGAVVYDLESESELVHRRLPFAPFAAAVDFLVTAGFQPVVYESPAEGERVFTGPNECDNEATAHYFVRPSVAAQRISLPVGQLRTVCQPLLVAAMGDEGQVTDLAHRVEATLPGCETLIEQQSFVPGSRWWQVDITAPGTSKGAALQDLCAFFQLPLEQTVAIGDGINDLDLIRTAGFGVAMGNAVPQVKSVAAAVVGDNTHDGAAEALERFVLSKDPAGGRVASG